MTIDVDPVRDRMRVYSALGETCTCGGESIARPSGDRVCIACGKAWAIGEIRTEPPKP